MNVLVVGGTGLIGWHAVLELCTRGHKVRVLARRPPQGITLPERATFVSGDYLNGGLSSALDGLDGIVFAAGYDYRQVPRGSAWDFFRRTNVEAPARLFKEAERAGVQRGVFVTSYYPLVEPKLIADHPYIRSRAESEPAALNACQGGLNLSIIQPSWVVGLGFAGHLSLSDFYARLVRSFAPLFAPPGGTNFVAATSLGHAIATALEQGRHGDRFLVGDENILWADLLERFARAAGRQEKVRTIPKGLFYGLSTSATLYLRIMGRELGLEPQKWSRFFAEQVYFDPSPTQQVLRYPIGNINQIIAETVNFYQTNSAFQSADT